MFSRVAYDSFQLLFAHIGFFLFATIFIGVLVKVFLMKKSTIDHLSSMPLNDEQNEKPASNHERETR
jgi:cbb3-type cytochrome oxidase subunit 3